MTTTDSKDHQAPAHAQSQAPARKAAEPLTSFQQQYLDVLKAQVKLMGESVRLQRETKDILAGIAFALAPQAPNYRYPIADFPTFDWSQMGAEVIRNDSFGASEVRWGGYVWTRRAPQNKFSEAVWFSRPNGKNAAGDVQYVRLITFKDSADAEPLPPKVEQKIERKANSGGQA